jgi:two-component system LytT family response regulator
MKAVQKIYHHNLNVNPRKIITQELMLDKIMIKTASNIYLRKPDQIIRLESEKSHVKVVLKDEDPLLSLRSLKSFESLLSPPGFLRVHPSHLINTNYIQYVDKNEKYLIMADQAKVPFSLKQRELLMDLV